MLICRQCGKEFVFTRSEQEFYELKGFVQPLHCKECRTNRRNQTPQLCSTCGLEIPKGKPVYCSSCLAAVQLGCDLETRRVQQVLEESQAKLSTLEIEKAKQIDEINAKLNTLESQKSYLADEAESKLKLVTSEQKKLLDEAEMKLKASESEKARLIESLQQKELAVAGLEQRLNEANLELEKSLKYRAALEFLEPTLINFKEKLEAIERTQTSLSNRMLQLVRKTEEAREDISIFEMIRRLFHLRHRPPTLNERS